MHCWPNLTRSTTSNGHSSEAPWEYFLLADDASDDLDDVFGFDDDARVVNSMLDRIGRPQHRIELS